MRLLTVNFIFMILISCLGLSIQGAFAKDLEIETIDIFPFGYMDENGKPAGLIYEASNLIGLHSGLKYKNTIIPYQRTIEDLKSGIADFIIRYSNDELEQCAIPLAKILGFKSIIVGPKGKHYKNLTELYGKMVGKVRGAKFDDRVFNEKRIIKYEARNYEQIIQMLLEHRVDAIIGSEIGIYSTMKKLNIKKSQLGDPLYLQEKFFIVHISKNNKDQKTIQILKDTIEKLQRSGEFKKLAQKYQ